MNKLDRYVGIVSDSYSLSSKLVLSTALQNLTSEKNELIDSLKSDGTIKVPLVGDFNAGKSSLLNAFIGRESLLPVEITPETAVAYEIYYDINEKVDLYREGDKIEECSLDKIKTLSTRPGDIAKVYVNSSKIKDLELKGITLVDMPGIDSGIAAHNDAILNYIHKGTAFILLVDCAGGSLRKSTIAFISELSKYNLKPSVLLTKTDKKPAEEITSIMEFVEFQSKRAVGADVFVGKISSHNNELEDFEKILNGLNVEELVSLKYASRINLYLDKQIQALVAQSKIYSANIEDAEQKITMLVRQREEATATINNAAVGDTPEKSTQDVLDLVESNLEIHSEEIARMAIDKENPDAINARILNYIRPVIVMAFKEEGQQYASAMSTVVDQVSVALQDNMVIDGNIFDSLIEDFHDEITGGISVAADILIAMPNIFAKALGWVLQLLGDKVPAIMRWLLGKSKDDMLQEAVEKVEREIIPSICERLRPEILKQITAQQERIRNNMSNNVASAIDNMQDSIIASKEMKDKVDLEAKVREIEKALDQLRQYKPAI